jgi:hypothetical protein
MWTLGRQGFPFITIFLVCPAVLLVVNFQMKIVGWVLMAEVNSLPVAQAMYVPSANVAVAFAGRQR